MSLIGNKITREGYVIIKASRYRTQERNKQDAIDRLVELLKRAVIPPKKRKKSKPTKASKERRLTQKKLHGKPNPCGAKPFQRGLSIFWLKHTPLMDE